MNFNDKALSSALVLVWKHLPLAEPLADRLLKRTLHFTDAFWSAEIVFSPTKIRALKEEGSSLFRDLPDTLQPGFFLATLERYRGPCIAVVKRLGEVVGVVYGWEMMLRGIPTGCLYVDESLELAVATTKEHRESVLRMALSAWLNSGRIGALRITLPRESRDVDTVREVASAYSVQRSEELRELHPILSLPPSYEDFEKTLGSNTRKHIRQYRGYSQNNNQHYVRNMDVCEFRTAVAMLSEKMKFAVTSEEVQRILDMASELSVEKRMLAGLRAEDGEWVAAVMGWKESGRGVLVDQFNDDMKRSNGDGIEVQLRSNSTSTLLRSFLIEQLIDEGFEALWVYGATGGFLTRYTQRLPGVTIYLDRPTLLWRTVRAIAELAKRRLPKKIANKLDWINPPKTPPPAGNLSETA